jgi:hypothetical protein
MTKSTKKIEIPEQCFEGLTRLKQTVLLSDNNIGKSGTAIYI